MDPRLDLLYNDYDVLLRRDAIAVGYSDATIAKLVRTGAWHRVRRGAYVPTERWQAAGPDERYRLVVKSTMRQAQTPVVASHTAAVAMLGGPLWGQSLDVSHLTRFDARTGRKEAGVQQHRGILLDGDVVDVGPYKVTSPTRAALEVTTLAGIEASLCVVNEFLHRDLTTIGRLRSRYELMSGWPNTLHTDLVLRLADGRIESVGETRTMYGCWSQGLPRPVPQLEIYDDEGNFVGRVDFAWPEYGVFLEFDGVAKYRRHLREGETIEDAVLREKRREERICEITGWRCIRVTWADLANLGLLGRRIRAMLGSSRIA